MTEPNDLVAEYLRARNAREKAQADLDEAQSRLLKQMEADQRKSFKWTDDGRSRSLTYVVKRTTVVDEPGLRKALTAKVYDKYTKRILDRRAMERALDAGEVDPVTVSRFVSMKPHNPYLDYREKEITE